MQNESGFDPENFAPQAGHGGLPAEAAGLPQAAKDFIRQYSPADDDSGCIGGFEWYREYKPFLSKQATEKEGKPVEIFENVLYVRINIRGSDRNEVHRPATEADKRRFPFAWQEFNRGENARARGVPLQMLGLDAPILRQFAAKNVFTVEDLCEVSDNNLQNLGLGGREMRNRAQAYLNQHLAATKSSVALEAQQDVIAQQGAQIAAQGSQLAQALAAIDKLTEENRKLTTKKKPGPKAKVPAAGQEG